MLNIRGLFTNKISKKSDREFELEHEIEELDSIVERQRRLIETIETEIAEFRSRHWTRHDS